MSGVSGNCPRHKWWSPNCSWCRCLLRIAQLEREVLGTGTTDNEIMTAAMMADLGMEE